jgi:hypothetical protein
MSRISPSPISSGAIDDVGVSVTVSPRRASDPRYGTVYDPAGIAGVVPVHLHRLTTDQYIMVFSRRWHTATTSATDPGGYTAYSQDTSPGWMKVGVPTGQPTAMGSTYAIPMRTTYDSAVLADAVSRSTEYLYLLTSVTKGSVTTGVVSHWWHNTTTGSVQEIAEESITEACARPVNTTELAWQSLTADERSVAGDKVVFNRGLWFLTPHLLVFGASSDNRLFMVRKPWGRIGINDVEQPSTMYRVLGTTAEDPRWSYYTGDGWSVDRSLAAPIVDSKGAVITSLGPVSVASFRDRTWLATVIAEGDNRLARIYSQRGQRVWTVEDTVSLGSVADGSYLGDTLRFQQQVPPATSSDPMSNPANDAALVYVVSTKSVSGDISRLNNTWGLWSIPRAGAKVSPLDSTSLNATLAVTATRTAATGTSSAGVGGS